MKKAELKQLIKPLVKECIHEVLLEEGLVSNVVAEVAKGMQGNLVVEATQKNNDDVLFNEGEHRKRHVKETNNKLQEHRKKMMDAVGKDAYNGVDIFENVQPTRGGTTSPAAGAPDLGDAGDPGVDISSLFNSASKVWQAMK